MSRKAIAPEALLISGASLAPCRHGVRRDGASSRRPRPSMASRNRLSIACCASGGTPGRLGVPIAARPASYRKPNWNATSS